MSWLRSLPLLALGIALGCQNNTIMLEFDTRSGSDDDDDDGSDTESTAGSGTMTAATDTINDTTEGNPDGPQTLLLALSTPLGPELPFQALVTVNPGAGAVDLSMQWLSLDVGSVLSPRQPVGDVYAYAGLPVDDSGVFFWDTGVILIPGAANPLTGQDLVVSVQANVVPAGTPAYCGEAGGLVLMPDNASLDVSTHAMTATSPNNLPVDFPVSCP